MTEWYSPPRFLGTRPNDGAGSHGCIFEVKHNRGDKEIRAVIAAMSASNTMRRRGCMTRIVAALASVSS